MDTDKPIDISSKLDDIFNLPTPIVPSTPPKKEEPDEIDYTINKLKIFLELGEEAYKNSVDVAIQTGESEPVKALAMLLKALNETSHTIMANKKIDKEIKAKESKPDAPSKTINNTAVFIGSGKDLMKSLNNPPVIDQ